MFTGIIVEMGEVVRLRRRASGASFAVKADTIVSDVVVGDSIAVNGACLTVVGVKGKDLTFDLSDETLRATNLGQLRPGERVNLEPSLRTGGKMGGHFVTGHVDATGKIRTKTAAGDAFSIVIEAPEEVTRFLVEKGSVAIDGISLTVVDVSEGAFSVVIIPHTARVTTIGFKGRGDLVNLEADIIGKYVARFLSKERPKGEEGLMKSLAKAGFV